MIDWIVIGIIGASLVMLLRNKQQEPAGIRRAQLVQFAAVLLFGLVDLVLPWLGLSAAPLSIQFVTLLGVVVVLSSAYLPRRNTYLVQVILTSIGLLLMLTGTVLGESLGLGSSESMKLWYIPHVASAMGAMTVAISGGVCAALFLIQDNALKTGNVRLSARLPSVTSLGRLLEKFIAVSALLFTLTVLLGSAMSVYVWHKPFSADPFSLSAIVGFAAQVLLYIAQIRAGWASRRLAFITLAVFIFWIVLVGLGATLLPTEHSLVGLR